ncbi:hypothetical protein [Actinoplanes sp. DH11]|uniref:hypothetical protein n=1 Tax=Actinoplanes sp. DH11 TaxID=2857011 RepID=UPI001E645AC5|nr:hypothetical protein [Actinoplanes sp. DH11]
MTEVSRPDEAAVDEQRRAKYAALPPRIRPDDFVGSVETRKLGGRPSAAMSEAQAAVLPISG